MLSIILVLIVAAIHFYFTFLEMARWEAPRTRAIFGLTAELASQTRFMAANQGLYNAFIAAGLIFGLLTSNTPMVVFLLLCVIVAGAYAAMGMGKRVLIVQSLPAALALLAILAGL